MPNPYTQYVQVVDNLALVPLSASEVATLNLASLGVITISESGGGGSGAFMLQTVYATINPGAGYVDKSVTALTVPYTGLTALPGGSTLFLRADGTFSLPPGQTYTTVSSVAAGLAPILLSSGGASTYLRGDASWQPIASITIPYSNLTSLPSSFFPSAHETTHITGGTDVILPANTSRSGLVPILPSANQTLSFLRGDSSWQQIPLQSPSTPGLAPASSGTTTTFLSGAGTYLAPSFPSLSNLPSPYQFPPSPHAPTHLSSGSDPIQLFSVGGSTSGLVPGSPGGTTAYLRADGTWDNPPGGGGLSSSSGAGLLQQLQAVGVQNLYYLRGDNSWQLISSLSITYSQVTGVPVFAGGSAGLVPNSSGGTNNFLRADGTFSVPPTGGPLASTGGAGTVPTLPSSGATYYLDGLNQWTLISTLTVSYSLLTNLPSTFPPSPHETTHITGGTDVILSASTTHSGLVPILPSTNIALNFLRGDSTWAAIPLATAAASGFVVPLTNISTQWLRADNSWQAIPGVSGSAAGLAPSYPGNTTTFLNGQGQYTVVAYATLGSLPSTFPPSPHASTHISGGLATDIIPAFTTTSSGLVPSAVGFGVGSFLQANGVWATPSGSGNVLSTEQINTADSLTGGGDLSANRTLTLVGDVATPASTAVYSYLSGSRGWNVLSSFPVAVTGTPGLLPSLSGNAAQFLSGGGTFTTPLNFSSTLSGYAPFSGGGTANFLRADGSWVIPYTPILASSTTGGIVQQLPATGVQTLYYLRGDNTWQTIASLSIGYSQISGVPVFSGTTTAGLVPGTSGGSASVFLRGDASFSMPPLALSATPGYIAGLPSSSPTSYWARGDNSWQLLYNYVLVTNNWLMPTIGTATSSGAVSVNSTAGLESGMTVLTGAPGLTQCVMEISSLNSSTTLTLFNRGYSVNPGQGTTIPASLMSTIGPGIASSHASGFVPTPTGTATQYLDGTGSWSVPAGSGGLATVTTADSITGNGSVGSPVQLVNDSASPGAFRFYSTNAVGALGWFPLTYSWETSASFTMPVVGGPQTISLVTNVGMIVGTTIVIEDNQTPPSQAFFEVTAVNSNLTSITVVNRGYAFNSGTITGATFNGNAAVTLAGPATATGSTPGFVPNSPSTNSTSLFYSGAATFITPPTVNTTAPGYVPTAPNVSTQFLNGIGGWSTPSVGNLAITGTQGAVPGLTASNQSTEFLRGDNTWVATSTLSSQIAFASLSGLPSTFTPSAHAPTHLSTGTDPLATFSTTTTTSGVVVGSNNLGTTYFLRADGTWATPPASPGLATSSATGLLQELPSSAGATYYLNGLNAFALISGLSLAWGQLTSGVPTSFTPSAHASTHISTGTDPIPPVNGTVTGLVPVLPASAPTTKFLRGDATWTVIPPVTGSVSGLVPAYTGGTTFYFNGAGAYSAVPLAIAGTSGLAPALPSSNGTSQWLRGDGTYVNIPFYWTISASFTQPAASGTVIVTFVSTTGMQVGMCIATVDTTPITNFYTVSSINVNGVNATLINTGATGNTAAFSTVNAGQANLAGPPVMGTGGNSIGLVPLSPGGTTEYLCANGAWSVPPSSGLSSSTNLTTQYSITGGGLLSSGLTLNLTNDTASPAASYVYGTSSGAVRGWQAFTSFPVATTSNAGLLTTLNGNTSQFLNGNGVFAAPSSLPPASTGTAGTVVGLPSTSLQTSQWLRADNSWQFMPDSNSTTASWTMPAIGSPVTLVTFNSTSNWDAGMTLFFATGAASTCCYMEVTTVTNGTQLTLTNRGYATNPVSGTVIPTSLAYVVSPTIASVVSTVGYAGLVPAPTNNTLQYLRGDATWAGLPDTWTLSATFTQPAIGSNVNATFVSTTNMISGMVIALSSGTVTNFMSVTSITSGTVAVLNNLGCATNTTALSTVNTGPAELISTPIATSTSGGILGVPPGGTTTFLNGSNAFSAVPYSSLTGAPGIATNTTVATAFPQPAIGSPLNINVTLSTGIIVGNGVFIVGGGYYPVTAVPDTTHITILNNGYTLNVSAATSVLINSAVYIVGNCNLFSSTKAGDVPLSAGGTVNFLRADATWNPIPPATSTVAGLVPTPPNNADQWLRGDATWVQGPPLAKTATATFNWPASGGTVTLAVDSTTNITAGMALYFPALGVAEVTAVSSPNITIRNNLNTGNAGSTAGIAIGTSIYVGGSGALMTATTSGVVPNPTSLGTSYFLSGGASWLVPPTATATTPGYVSPPNNTTTFYRGDATFSAVAYANVTGTPVSDPFTTVSTFTIPAAGTPVTLTIAAATWPIVGQVVNINDGTNYGFFEITTVTSSTSIAVTNRGYVGTPITGTMGAASMTLACVGQATASNAGLVPKPPGNATTFLDGNAAFITPPSATATVAGYVPTPPNNTYQYLRGDATFVTPPLTTVTTAGFTQVAIGSNTASIAVESSGWMSVGMVLLVGIPSTATYNYMTVVSKADTTHCVLTNIQGATVSGTIASGANILETSIPIVSPSNAGIVPVPPGNTTTFLNGNGLFSTPSGTGVTTSDSLTGTTALTLVGDVTTPSNGQFYGYNSSTRGWSTPPSATATVAGYVPTPPNNTTTFLRGDATFANPCVTGTTTSSTFTIPGSGSTVVVAINAVTWPILGQKIYISDGTHTMFGLITTVGSSTSITVLNTGDTGNSISGTMGTAAGVQLVDYQSLVWDKFTAGDADPPTTNYATFDIINGMSTLGFVKATTTGAVFKSVLPQYAAMGLGIIVRINWASVAAVTGNVTWGAAFEPTSLATFNSNNFGTQVTVTTTVSTTAGLPNQTVITVPYSDMGSAVSGNVYRLQIQRLSTDTMVGNAELIAVTVESAAF